jgi:hypothetical protein
MRYLLLSLTPGDHGQMQRQAYEAIARARKEFRSLVEAWSAENSYLLEAQEKVRQEKGYEDYRVETSVVYNRALDDIGPEDEPIKIILVADNPGKNEQLAANNRYLVGQSGKLAEGWFKRELDIDFRHEVLILNKTPVHTPKTAELGLLKKHAGMHRERLEALLAGSQAAMAALAWGLYANLRTGAGSDPARGSDPAHSEPWPVLWISGLGELRSGGLFEVYRDELIRCMAKEAKLAKAKKLGSDPQSGVWAFNHFSMNQFAIEVKKKARPRKPLLEELGRIGRENRERVFGL